MALSSRPGICVHRITCIIKEKSIVLTIYLHSKNPCKEKMFGPGGIVSEIYTNLNKNNSKTQGKWNRIRRIFFLIQDYIIIKMTPWNRIYRELNFRKIKHLFKLVPIWSDWGSHWERPPKWEKWTFQDHLSVFFGSPSPIILEI